MHKKGYFFTLDVIIAIVVIAIGLYFVFSARSEVPYYTTHQYLSEDMMTTLSSITVRELDNAYAQQMIGSGEITQEDNTLMEQMGEFYYRSKNGCTTCQETLENFTREVTQGSIPSNYQYALLIKPLGGEYELVYGTAQEQEDLTVLISSKRLSAGFVNTDELWGPYLFEVRVWQ